MKTEVEIVNSDDDLSLLRNRPTMTTGDIKGVAWFFAAVLMIILMTIALYALTGNDNNSETENKQSTVSPAAQTYVVRDFNGKVAVFNCSSNEPLEVYDTDTASLPDTDKRYLSEGIYADTDEELETIIEDLTS